MTGGHMDQEPAAPPPEPQSPQQDSGGSPKFLVDMKGWVAGVTALVVALGGLATAYKQIWGDKPAEQPAVATAPAAAPAAAEHSPAAADTTAQPEEGAPTLYEGDGIR